MDWTASFSLFQQDLIWSLDILLSPPERGISEQTGGVTKLLIITCCHIVHYGIFEKKDEPVVPCTYFLLKSALYLYSRFVFLILGGVTKLLIIACSHSRIHTHNHSACIPALCHHHLRSILIVIFVSSRNIYNYSITNHPPVSSVIIIFS